MPCGYPTLTSQKYSSIFRCKNDFTVSATVKYPRRYMDANNIALIEAIKYNDLHGVKMYVENGADVNFHYNRLPVLERAARYGNINIIRYLVEQGAEVNYKINGRIQWSVLTTVTRRGDIETIDYLLEQGAKIDKHTLAYSLRYGYPHIFRYLLGKSYMTTDDSDLLHYWFNMAVMSGSIESVKYLLQRGADADSAGKCGTSAIFYEGRGKVEMVKFLYSMGSNPFRIDTKTGMNALERREHRNRLRYQESTDFLREAMKNRVLPLRNLCIIVVYRLQIPHGHIPEVFFDM